jgi:hypothetical protein
MDSHHERLTTHERSLMKFGLGAPIYFSSSPVLTERVFGHGN